MSDGADHDLSQETLRQGLGLIAEKLDGTENIAALTQAVQYLGLLKFHELMLRHSREVIASKFPGSDDDLELEAARVNLVAMGLKKVPAPPFLDIQEKEDHDGPR